MKNNRTIEALARYNNEMTAIFFIFIFMVFALAAVWGIWYRLDAIKANVGL